MRQNSTIEAYSRAFVNYEQDNWASVKGGSAYNEGLILALWDA